MAVSYCGHCGQPGAEGDSFCVACGTRLRHPSDALPAAEAIESSFSPGSQEHRDDLVVLKHAVALIERREPKTAVAVLERLCAERPEWAVARAYLGVAYLRCTRVADARWELEEAVRIAPGSFICRTKLAEFLARLGFYDQALAQLDIAAALPSPDDDSKRAALELRQFCKDKAKGIFYRRTSAPRFNFRNFLPGRRQAPAPNAHMERTT